MSLIASECCCTTDMDCFFGLDADTLCCRLSAKDILMLKVERPAGSQQVFYEITNNGGGSCACTGYKLRGTLSWDASPDLLVMYQPLLAPTATGGRTHVWFCDDGSFGSGSFGDSRASLYPPSESACCDTCNDEVSPCTCSCETAWFGPVAGMGNPAGGGCTGCTSGSYNLDTLQKELILGTSVAGVDETHGCGDLSTVTATTTCDTGDTHKWLQGIANDSNDYRHWYWDPHPDVLNYVESTSLMYLAQTLVGVFHPERWWEACYKYPADLGSAWNCRVPNWWAFGCSGVPVFSWEIGRMQEEGILSAAETKHFFRQTYENKPLGATSDDLPTGAEVVTFIEKLEKNTFTHSDQADGVGVLQTKDWYGYTKNDGTTVPITERKIIRKDLSRWSGLPGSGGTETIVYDQFYYGRPGGWSEICLYPSSGTCPGTSPEEVPPLVPQVPRGKGCDPSGGWCDEAERESSCWTAGPFPTATRTCVTGAGLCNGCDACDFYDNGGALPPSGCATGCDIPFLAACDIENDVCDLTTYHSTCSGIHFQYNGYTVDTYVSSTTTDQPFDCAVENHAWLWVLDRHLDESSDTAEPFGCETPNCPPGAYDDLGDVTGGITPPQMSNNIRCGDPASNPQTVSDFCGGSNLTVSAKDPTSALYKVCFATGHPKAATPDKEDPGNGMVGPYTVGGCGRYLCNEKHPLGACCKTDATSRPPVVTCIDAVTAAQCEKCEEDANVTTVWKGPDSPTGPSPCCGDSPCT